MTNSFPLSSDLSDADVSDRTARIQVEIDRTAAAGGGVVTIPPGEWNITTLFLRDRIRLHLPVGAILKADGNLDAYPDGGCFDKPMRHLIVAKGCRDVAIEGHGMIDGNDTAFWQEPLRDLKARGVDISADVARMPPHWPEDSPFWRAWGPRVHPLLELRDCVGLHIEGVTIRRSPGWTVHTIHCDHVVIRDIVIDNHLYGPNTDGLDIDGCHDVRVSGCRISCCDDAIILKAKSGERACDGIVVSDCVLNTLCAALGLGAECDGDIRNVVFSNCVVERSLRMIQFEMWSAGLIENVTIHNISGRTFPGEGAYMEKVVYMDIQQHLRTPPCELGHIRNVVISGITAATRGRCILTAQEGATMRNITLRDLHLHYPEIEDAEALSKTNKSSQNSNFNPDARRQNAVLVAENIDGLTVDNLRADLPPAGDGAPAMAPSWIRNVKDLDWRSPHLRGNTHDSAECP